VTILRRLVAAFWFGGALFLAAIAAPAAFSAAPTSGIAGDIVGAMITRWHYVAIGVPLLLLILELRRPTSRWAAIILTVALLAASAEAVVDLRVRQIRESSIIPITLLPKSSARRQAFGRLHGTSMLLLALQIATAAATVCGGGDSEKRR
jgi:hypothetical protein